ncbi:MAG: hypothetical protein PF904_03530 [Kiritimatiellae bacterium]|jgi:hypothetical protein|nr:hypothetical protein [Kiritimatiellia bacterium]
MGYANVFCRIEQLCDMHSWFRQQRYALHRRKVLITTTEDRGWREEAIALDIGSSLLDIGYSTFLERKQ